MTALTTVLLLKTLITIVFLAGPLLTLPQAKLNARLGLPGTPLMFLRLYGVAMASLVIAYASGIWQALQGDFPWGIVAMGIVSNGGAAAVLATLGPPMLRRIPAALFGAIAIALLACALFPENALAPLF